MPELNASTAYRFVVGSPGFHIAIFPLSDRPIKHRLSRSLTAVGNGLRGMITVTVSDYPYCRQSPSRANLPLHTAEFSLGNYVTEAVSLGEI